ncbi:unnamed protein product, partial [Adineta steineri]
MSDNVDHVRDQLNTINYLAEANQREDALQKINNLVNKFENQYHVQEKPVQETNNGNPLEN